MKMLQEHEDAFGQAMMDYVEGINMQEAARTGCAVWFSPFESWALRERKAIQFAKGKVLDIGCAAGRHSLYLQDKRLDVLAVDNSPIGLRVCRRRGVKNTRLVSFHDITPQLGLFDTIILFGNNFGLMGSAEKAREMLTRFFHMTTETALILAGAGSFEMGAIDEALLEKTKNTAHDQEMCGEFLLQMTYREFKTPPIEWLFCTQDEMKQIVSKTGWKISTIITDRSEAYIAILEKDHS